MKLIFKSNIIFLLLSFSSFLSVAQINTDRVMNIGRNALYFEDYILSMQYFNQVIKVKPYMAEPYFYRGVAKLSLDDFKGAEEDCTLCIERNPLLSMPIKFGVPDRILGIIKALSTTIPRVCVMPPKIGLF